VARPRAHVGFDTNTPVNAQLVEFIRRYRIVPGAVERRNPAPRQEGVIDRPEDVNLRALAGFLANSEETTMSNEGSVTYELRDAVAWLGLNRPHKRNAIGDALLAELEAMVRRAQDEARALVVFGHGPCFSAGLDLAEHRAREPTEAFHLSRAWHEAFSLLRGGRVPVIAALHGATIGGGLELAAACHIRIADKSAFFALPEGMRGIYVGGGASVYVARLLGASRMADMMLTGRVMDAAAAERAGLVQYLVPDGAAMTKAEELAGKVSAMAPLTILGVLHALPRIQDMNEADGLFVESLTAALSQSGREAEARLAEFVAKRSAKVSPPAESSIAVLESAASSRTHR
jgi:(methylthio)acryloyl-CoA hydratase